MLFLLARVSRGPRKGRPLMLARNRRRAFTTADPRTGIRYHHASEDDAARAVFQHGHGAWFSPDGRGGGARFHRLRAA